MSVSTEEFKEKVKSIVQDHYEKDRSPLLLARLGADIEQAGAWPVDRNGRSLKRLLEDLLSPELDLIWDKRSPAFIAVVTPEVRAEVEAQIQQRQGSGEKTSIRLEDLAWPFLVAFCVHVPGENPVYVRRSRPFRYESKPPDVGVAGEYLIVEPEYRRPGLRIDRLERLPSADRVDLSERIRKWAEAHGVPIEQFLRSDDDRSEPTSSGQTALDRLVAAQSPDIARRILIPSDIAQILAGRR